MVSTLCGLLLNEREVDFYFQRHLKVVAEGGDFALPRLTSPVTLLWLSHCLGQLVG